MKKKFTNNISMHNEFGYCVRAIDSKLSTGDYGWWPAERAGQNISPSAKSRGPVPNTPHPLSQKQSKHCVCSCLDFGPLTCIRIINFRSNRINKHSLPAGGGSVERLVRTKPACYHGWSLSSDTSVPTTCSVFNRIDCQSRERTESAWFRMQVIISI